MTGNSDNPKKSLILFAGYALCALIVLAVTAEIVCSFFVPWLLASSRPDIPVGLKVAHPCGSMWCSPEKVIVVEGPFASGVNADFPTRLGEALAKFPGSPPKVCFASPGGKFDAGDLIAREVGKRKLNTCVAHHYVDDVGATIIHAKDAICGSHCIWALAAGVHRVSYSTNALLLLHGSSKTFCGCQRAAPENEALFSKFLDDMAQLRRDPPDLTKRLKNLLAWSFKQGHGAEASVATAGDALASGLLTAIVDVGTSPFVEVREVSVPGKALES